MTNVIKTKDVKTFDGICLNSQSFTENDNVIVKPVVLMKSGVFNDYLKIPMELEKSAKWWNVPIVIQSRFSAKDHPNTVIVTNKTVRVGQVRNVQWDIANERLIGEAHFYKELCPDWLLKDIMENKVKGVSGTYFADLKPKSGEYDGKKYSHIEMNYVPNNLAIVENPACSINDGCGINMNSEKDMAKKTQDEKLADDEEYVLNEKGEPELDENGKPKKKKKDEKPKEEESKDSDVIVKNSKGDNMAEIDDMKKQLEDMGVQMNALKEESTKKDAVIADLQKQIEVFENAKKEEAFLSQFPPESREAARTELLGVFMKDPRELVMNHAKRLGELLIPAGVERSVGTEHVEPIENADEVDKMLPDVKRVRDLIRGKA